MIANGRRVLAYRSIEYIKDMGTPDRLQRVEADWRAGKIGAGRAQRRRMPAVFLDRDGTLNVERGFLRTAQELELLPGVGAALKSLRQAGFRLVLVTNQPVIARGEASDGRCGRGSPPAGMGAGHRRRLSRRHLCLPAPPRRGIPRRACRAEDRLRLAASPAPASSTGRAKSWRSTVTRSWMIGDQTRDIEMARRAGLRSVLVRTGAAGTDGQYAATPDCIADDLTAAASVILIERKQEIA